MVRSQPQLSILPLVALAAPICAQDPTPPSTGGSNGPSIVYTDPMMRGDSSATSAGFTFEPVLTVSERPFGYIAPGRLDGIGAFPAGADRATVLVNHELGGDTGSPYALKNGTTLTGARISALRLQRKSDGQVRILEAGLAYETVYDRHGVVVTDAAQINEVADPTMGFARFCSAHSVLARSNGFVDGIFFAGEESSKPAVPHGGTEWALDVRSGTLWAAPALGRGGWENVTDLDTGDDATIALLMGSDVVGAPLFLYVGRKDAVGDGSFLDRNGLAVGTLYAWRSDSGDLSPEDFHGLNELRSGAWVALTVQDPAQAGMPGYDDQGYADGDTLSSEADALGCFSFSRPEDVDTNPFDGTQAAFNSTGRGQQYPSDNWGTVYVVDIDFASLRADLVIVHDADGLADPDTGIRSPDNVDWATDGNLYIQEDRSTSPDSLFGGSTGIEASLWKLNPITRKATRIGEIDRSVIAPDGATDQAAGDIGNWESSGVLEVTGFFGTAPRERLFLLTVQAHGITDGPIATANLVEGAQLILASKIGE